VFLRSGFQAEGVVRLVGGNIGMHLDLERAHFSGKAPNGLIAENLTVTGEFRWTKVVMTKETILDLSATRVGQPVDGEHSWPAAGKLDLDEFTYTAIPDGPMDAHRRMRWLARQTALPLDSLLEPSAVTPKPFRPKPYQQLAKVLRESGRETDATRILIAKEVARRKHGGLGGLPDAGLGFSASRCATGMDQLSWFSGPFFSYCWADGRLMRGATKM
jgi:hypothetical protein